MLYTQVNAALYRFITARYVYVTEANDYAIFSPRVQHEYHYLLYVVFKLYVCINMLS